MSSNIHTPSENIKAGFSICLAITAAATNGTSFDTLGMEDVLVTVYGAPSGSGTTSDFKVQESSDNSSFSDITGAAFTQMTTVGGAKTYVGNIKMHASRLRYLRLVHTGAGGSAAGQAAGFFHAVNARRKPVAQSNTVVFSV